MAGHPFDALVHPIILVVDDDPGFLRLVEKALRRESFSTAAAGSFPEAVDWLRNHQPDLMLLDLKLGSTSGAELIDHLAAGHRSVPFIIITGQGDERVAVAMMKRGAIDYLVKDSEFLQFVPEVVRRALGRLERDRKLSAAEEALRRSEENLARAQRIAHLGSYELTVSGSGPDYYSEEVYRILGLEASHWGLLRPATIAAMVHPADLHRYKDTLDQSIQTATPFGLDYRVVRSDGSVRHVQAIGEPVIDRAWAPLLKLVGTLLDITDRKRADLRQQVQYATTRSLAEAATLNEAAPTILRTVCETLDWEQGEFWQVDKSSRNQGSDAMRLPGAKVTGVPGSEESGSREDRVETICCLEVWGTQRTAVEREVGAGSHGGPLGAELPTYVWKTAKPLWTADLARNGDWDTAPALPAQIQAAAGSPVLLGGEVLGVVVFYSHSIRPPDPELLQMLTLLGSQIGQFLERTRTEEALRKEHAFTSAVLDTSAALVVVLNRDGRIVRFNRACELATGYAATEVCGKYVWELFLLPEEAEMSKKLFSRPPPGHFPNRNENHWLVRDGRKRLVAWSNSTLLDDDGSVEYVISIGIDVTEQRRLEQEILQISDMEQRRIGQDLHDGLCQHLAATELMCEITERKIARKSKADARRVADIGKHVREAISQTRLLARGLSPVVIESDGLMAALTELGDYTERMFRTDCRFECPQPVPIYDHGTATHLYRIAQEAVSNAIRHGKAKHIVISLERTGNRVGLEIKDDGTGLPLDFTKAKGMGLRIMQYRAAMIGGFLSVQSERAGGTSVGCSVPIKSA